MQKLHIICLIILIIVVIFYLNKEEQYVAPTQSYIYDIKQDLNYDMDIEPYVDPDSNIMMIDDSTPFLSNFMTQIGAGTNQTINSTPDSLLVAQQAVLSGQNNDALIGDMDLAFNNKAGVKGMNL